jgi:hypothetical protein
MDGQTDAGSADQWTDETDGATHGHQASTQKAPGPGNFWISNAFQKSPAQRGALAGKMPHNLIGLMKIQWPRLMNWRNESRCISPFRGKRETFGGKGDIDARTHLLTNPTGSSLDSRNSAVEGTSFSLVHREDRTLLKPTVRIASASVIRPPRLASLKDIRIGESALIVLYLGYVAL